MASKLASILEQIAALEKQAQEVRATEIKDLKERHLAELDALGLKFAEVWGKPKQAKPATEGKKGGSTEAKAPTHSWKDKSGKVHYLRGGAPGAELKASEFYKDGKVLKDKMHKLTEAEQAAWLADNAKK